MLIMHNGGLLETNIPDFELSREGSRDVYNYGDSFKIVVATDRVVFPTDEIKTIPDKGKISTNLCLSYWRDYNFNYYVRSSNLKHAPEPFRSTPSLDGRVLLVESYEPLDFNLYVYGYLIGKIWNDYRNNDGLVGANIRLPKGLQENHALPTPVFDVDNQGYAAFVDSVGVNAATDIIGQGLELYMKAADAAWHKGLLITNTKFKFGKLTHKDDEIVFIHDIFTPDSSLFTYLKDFELGRLLNYDFNFRNDFNFSIEKFSLNGIEYAKNMQLVLQNILLGN